MAKVLVFATLLLSFQISAKSLKDYPLDSYYPKDFQELYENNKLDSINIKNTLFKILTSAHQKFKTVPDRLVESCNKSVECTKENLTYSYKQAREFLFGRLHLEGSNKAPRIKDVYCEETFYAKDGVGPGKIPDYRKINCEHTWPQSRFNPKMNTNAQKTDLHHLFPTHSKANSTRSNLTFAEVDGDSIGDYCRKSKRGWAHGSTVTSFEPPINHRGNVARALFYFSVRYKISIDPLEEHFLRYWHEEDPVDSFERKRNSEIENIQGNRNPFIDAPDLVYEINDF